MRLFATFINKREKWPGNLFPKGETNSGVESDEERLAYAIDILGNFISPDWSFPFGVSEFPMDVERIVQVASRFGLRVSAEQVAHSTGSLWLFGEGVT